jgi:hypothetical protein
MEAPITAVLVEAETETETPVAEVAEAKTEAPISEVLSEAETEAPVAEILVAQARLSFIGTLRTMLIDVCLIMVPCLLGCLMEDCLNEPACLGPVIKKMGKIYNLCSSEYTQMITRFLVVATHHPNDRARIFLDR